MILAGIQFSHILDFMVMMPLGPILMEHFQLQTHQFGLLVAAYSFSAALSGVCAALLVDRFERRQVVLVLLLLFGGATLACALAPNYSVLLIARGLAGAFGGVLGAMVQTVVADAIPFERRARANAAISSAFSVSTVAGVPLSLWLATVFGWRAPFVLIALLAIGFTILGRKVLPVLAGHLKPSERPRWFAATQSVLRDSNHWRALLFSALVIFSGFTVIPYITLYAIGHVGIRQEEIPLIYLLGGSVTLLSARSIGKRADAYGKAKVYRILALLAVIPLMLVTHAGPMPLAGWMVITTSFFVLVSGRMIPAMAIISSAAEPRWRGTFMTLNGTTQSLAMGLATLLSGFLMTQTDSGNLEGYDRVGYLAIAANGLAIWFVSRVRVR